MNGETKTEEKSNSKKMLSHSKGAYISAAIIGELSIMFIRSLSL